MKIDFENSALRIKDKEIERLKLILEEKDREIESLRSNNDFLQAQNDELWKSVETAKIVYKELIGLMEYYFKVRMVKTGERPDKSNDKNLVGGRTG